MVNHLGYFFKDCLPEDVEDVELLLVVILNMLDKCLVQKE